MDKGITARDNTMNRCGEAGNSPIRTKRVYKQGNYWYYSTREQINIGPFDSCSEAESGVGEFVDFIMHAEPSVLESLTMYRKAA